jgi:hypothetical protein
MASMRTPALLLVAMLAAAAPAVARADGPAKTIHVRPRGGIAFHPQLDRAGWAAGASATLGVALDGALAFGVSAEHLRFTYRQVDVPVDDIIRADFEATLSVTPILLELEARFPLGAAFTGFVGGGAGAIYTRVETRDLRGNLPTPDAAGALALAGSLHAGLGIGLGPGRLTVEGRFHIGDGEVDGAATGIWAGGLAGMAGYELDF